MQVETFSRILTAFADSPADIDLAKGRLLTQVRDEVIEASLSQYEGELWVEENGERSRAARWLINRIARLPLLADRILAYAPETQPFVPPTGNVLDQPDHHSGSDEQPVADAPVAISEILARRPGGTTSVVYLTSDAGEGKTTVINRLARSQAMLYRQKQTDWLLVPISLGGRAFLRFDDVVIAALVNKLRFQLFYFEAFIELVKLGVIVPAFDGFEEMFVESSSGEALSALGNLVRSLGSSGTVLIAARKAYFEYQSFAAQARLLDGMSGESVAFARVSLRRWSKEQFLSYANQRGLAQADSLYEGVRTRFGDTHPLLTRAVLVRRLVDVAANASTIGDVLDQLGSAPQDYFFQFVNAIIEREANEKWIDRSGEPYRQLISVPEHHQLLSMVASEMWIGATDSVKADVLDVVAELFSDSLRKTPVVARQVRERVKQHSLLVTQDGGRSFSFDHEDFRKFFLGDALGRALAGADLKSLREFLQVGPLPSETCEAAIHYVRRNRASAETALPMLQRLCESEAPASYIKENAGLLSLALLDVVSGRPIVIHELVFPPDALRGRRIEGVTFTGCYFQATSLDGATIKGTVFENCRFDRLELSSTADVSDTTMSDVKVSSVVNWETDEQVFGPGAIESALRDAKFSLPGAEQVNVRAATDESTRLLERALRVFLRANQVNEEVFRHRLGTKANKFMDEIVPSLLRCEILEEIPYLGKGRQRRFRLAAPMQSIQEALQQSGGQFDAFLRSFL